jgi:hypothetical protein
VTRATIVIVPKTDAIAEELFEIDVCGGGPPKLPHAAGGSVLVLAHREAGRLQIGMDRAVYVLAQQLGDIRGAPLWSPIIEEDYSDDAPKDEFGYFVGEPDIQRIIGWKIGHLEVEAMFWLSESAGAGPERTVPQAHREDLPLWLRRAYALGAVGEHLGLWTMEVWP